MSKENKYQELAGKILELIGGKSNVSALTHCVTRLRFNFKDQSMIKQEEIKQLPGVMGCQFSNGQFQIIIGPEVKKVYAIIQEELGGEVEVDAVETTEKMKLTPKNIFNKILTTLTACITPALPVIICAGMLKVVLALFGPTMFNLLKEGTGVYTILNLASDAGFYFIPIYLGYTSAKHFKINVFLGMLMGAILVYPELVAIGSEGVKLSFLGLPITPVNYAYSVLPIVMIVALMAPINRFVIKIIPNSLQIILVDVLTLLITLPIALIVLGPLGNILSGYITDGYLALYNLLGPIGIGLIAATFLVLIITGMHHVVNMTAITTLVAVGYDNVIFVGVAAACIAVLGANLAFALKAKKAENKQLGITALFMQAVAGVVEPTLFGIYLPYKKVFFAQAIGAFVGGTLMGILGVKVFVLSGSNIFILAGFIGESANNFIYACIGCGVAAIISFIAVYVIGFEEK